MKKLKSLKNKFLMFIFALVLPLSASAMTFLLPNFTASAEDNVSTRYSNGYTKEITLSNSNFNNVSSHSIGTSLTGWSGQNNDRSTTAGIIDTGNSFASDMESLYRLSKNPNAKGSDKQVLMINSKTANSTRTSTARQGYRSNNITLSANSYYSFQVSFKDDVNYDTRKVYELKGTLDSDVSVSQEHFNEAKFGEYVSFTYQNRTYYGKKELTEGTELGHDLTDITLFYDDGEYGGFFDTNDENKAKYVLLTDITKKETPAKDENSQPTVTYDIASGTTVYECSVKHSSSSGSTHYYKIESGAQYFKQTNAYDEIQNSVYGSIYLIGPNKERIVEAERIYSRDWVTLYFFVATGDESQTVNLELWLGGKDFGKESSGVVFYDDVHIYQYCENRFWQTYEQYYGRGYNVGIGDEDTVTEVKNVNSVFFKDLRTEKENDYQELNFDFEDGEKDWQMNGGFNKARIFNTNDPTTFKRDTGYGFVGSTMTCDVELDEENKATIKAHQYVLGLWAKNDYSYVKSPKIDINANEIYKITAYYKISEIEGNVYMLVEEYAGSGNVLEKYNLTDSEYTLTKEKASTGVSTNGTDEFKNNYGTIEFYVKGNNFFNSAINFSLSIGKADEMATGAVVFDNITIEKATSAQYSSATNKVELNEKTYTASVPNGDFNVVTVSDDKNFPLSPNDWTISRGNGITFAGVINTETAQYDAYRQKYSDNQKVMVDGKNPYLWAKYKNPGNSLNKSTDNRPDNVLMLANFSDTTQTVKSSSFHIDASKAYSLSFSFKTYGKETVTVRVLGSDGISLYENSNLTTNGDDKWKTYEIYLKSFKGADDLTVEIELNGINKTAYFDAFTLTSITDSVFNERSNNPNPDNFGVVNMDDFYLNIPTNKIADNTADSKLTSDPKTSASPAYNATVGVGTTENNTASLVKSEYFKNNANFKIDESDKNVFFFTNQSVGSVIVQSNFNFDLNSSDSKYYKLTFKLKTFFVYQDPNSKITLDADKEYNYGATVGLTGFDYLTNLKTPEEFDKPYEMYFKVDSDTSAKLYMALVSDDAKTLGSMLIYDLTFDAIEEDEYELAQSKVDSDEFDLDNDKIFVSTKSDAPEDEETPEESDETPTPSANDSQWWIAIPTIIMAAAIILAVFALAMRKVKIKKIEKKRKETYDRKESLRIDKIKAEAVKQRDEEVKAVEQEISRFETELERMEKEHKAKVVALRAKDNGKVSKETDKEFKRFAQRRGVVAERVELLKKNVEQLKSPEHLLSLEHKLFAQDEAKQRELRKMSEKLNKEKERKSKKDTSDSDKNKKNSDKDVK